jgi:hypothetical protein
MRFEFRKEKNVGARRFITQQRSSVVDVELVQA